MSDISYTKTIPVRYETDVFIAGGGPSGTAAAWSASKGGARVLIADACGGFGGMGTLGRVPMFCSFTDGIHFLAGGFGKLIHDTCFSEGAVSPDDYLTQERKKGSISIVCPKLMRIYDRLMEESGAEISFYSKVIDVITNDGHIESVILSGQSSLFAVKAKIYIDATGDGVLSMYAGAECVKGDENGETQSGTLCSFWTDIDWEQAKKGGVHDLWPRNDGYLKEAVDAGVLSCYDPHLSGMWRTGNTTGGGNIGHAFNLDGTDERSLTRAVLDGRKLLEEYENYYRTYLPGFENVTLADTGSLMGVRETRRVMGDYVLSADDYINRASFTDEIGRFNYSIDFHASGKSAKEADDVHALMQKSQMKSGESYGIPYRCLTPKGLDNLLVSGRCVSCDRAVQASLRVMPGCYITGQAAGMAASIAAREGKSVHDVDTDILRRWLRDLGAYLPEKKNNIIFQKEGTAL